jgi:hypothetical protein
MSNPKIDSMSATAAEQGRAHGETHTNGTRTIAKTPTVNP